jgi:AraC family transcriptional regulator
MRALVQAVEAGELVLGGCARRRRIHASPLLSVDLWRCREDGDGLRAERSHAAPVLTVFLSGASVLQERGRAVVVEAGTLLLAGADITYRSAHPFGCGDTGCHIRPSPLLTREAPLARDRCLALPLDPAAHLGFRRAVERVVLAGADGLELEEVCLSLLGAVSGPRVLDARPTPCRRHRELVEEAKSVVLRRLGERVSVQDLAHAVGVSGFHLARLFRRHTGFSLHGYRTRMRLLRALDRLADARGALADLALELGFSSQSHFSDTFRKTFGVAPGTLGQSPKRKGLPEGSPCTS